MLTTKNGEFMLNDKPFKIYSGAIHYFRVPQPYWADRLKKLKAAGFNTVETYMPWNLHEPKKGEFNFSGMLDLIGFLKTAQEIGLYALLRPGPYICAEWDFGGLPAWLLKDENMQVRRSYKPYLDHVSDYYSVILPMIKPQLITNGGNIIAMQIENEYGSYFEKDKDYLRFIKSLYEAHDIDVLYFTSDGTHRPMMENGTLDDVLKTANFGTSPRSRFKQLRQFEKEGPLMCMEFWLGWFDHYGSVHMMRPAWHAMQSVKAMLRTGASFNVYMFHGGTNFGFTSGANYGKKYTPTITSYDYSAPLNEYGGYTKKYMQMRKAVSAAQGIPLAPLPPETELQHIGEVYLPDSIPLFSVLDKIGTKHQSEQPKSMEYFDQSFGYILYRHTLSNITNKASGTDAASVATYTLKLQNLADRAHVFVNGNLKGILERCKNDQLTLSGIKNGDTLDILVDAMGRVNYGNKMHDRKGISGADLNGTALKNFTVYTLPLDNLSLLNFDQKDAKSDALKGKTTSTFPTFFKGTFDAETHKDCFIHLKGFTKAVVFVNGINLGRFWNIGPQRSLYLPAPFLTDSGKDNEIIVFETDSIDASAQKANVPFVTITDIHKLK